MQSPPSSPPEFGAQLKTSVEELATVLATNRPATGDRTPLPGNLETVMRIPVAVKIVLGSTTMPVSKLMKLGRGAVIPLDRRVGEPVDVVVNGRVVARGEVVIVDEETSRFGVSLTEVIGPGQNDPST